MHVPFSSLTYNKNERDLVKNDMTDITLYNNLLSTYVKGPFLDLTYRQKEKKNEADIVFCYYD